MRQINFICKTCGIDFISKKGDKNRTPQFCSPACAGKSWAKYKKCLHCGKEFYNFANKYFCSMACFAMSRLGKPLTIEHRKSLSNARIGRFRFEKHHMWKGDDVGYGALHEWVYRVLGSPMSCEFCGEVKENNKQIHWANKSHKYLRKKDDWLRLCVRCHKNYDLGNKMGNSAKKDKRTDTARTEPATNVGKTSI